MKCPKCKEDIAEGAVKCKHCGADLRNWFARHKFISGVLVLIVLMVIISAASGGKDKSSSSSSSSTQTADANTTYKVGDVVQLKTHTLTVTSVNKNYSSGNQFDKPQDSNNSFVVVDVAFANTGDDDLLVNEFGFKLEDETGTQRNTTIGGLSDGKLQSVTLSKDGKTSGKIVFEAKKNSATLKLHYSPGVFGGDEIVINL